MFAACQMVVREEGIQVFAVSETVVREEGMRVTCLLLIKSVTVSLRYLLSKCQYDILYS